MQQPICEYRNLRRAAERDEGAVPWVHVVSDVEDCGWLGVAGLMLRRHHGFGNNPKPVLS